MAYQANPFLKRMSERTTSDQEFVNLFSPKILERIPVSALNGGVHIFTSPPGGGKTTLLRAFAPPALLAFWHSRRRPELVESYQRLLTREVFREDEDGPQLLGVPLSCASGYADLPPGSSLAQEGLFRALFDCRIVLRALRNLALLLNFGSTDKLASVCLEYDDLANDLKHIPAESSPTALIQWAEQHERRVYAALDSISNAEHAGVPIHLRFEGVLWLQSVRFMKDGKLIAPKRLLMVDDFHKLRRKQQSLFVDELTVIRPGIPVWIAERSIALGDELLSQGVRPGRDLSQHSLEATWSGPGGQTQFAAFAQNILDRRMAAQNIIPLAMFSQNIGGQLIAEDVKAEIAKGIERFRVEIQRLKSNSRYSEWLELANRYIGDPSFENLIELFKIRILLARDESKRQISLDLAPLSADEIENRDSSQVQAAAEIFVNDELNIPYFFGIDRICVMATSNVEELLSLAAALFEKLQAKQVLGKPNLILSPLEQEKTLKDVAKRKRDFIPKSHSEGTRAQRLLDATGAFCRERTFLPNAPIAPGVTGIRLSESELVKLKSPDGPLRPQLEILKRVMSESVAENLFFTRPSAPSTSREGGTIFYLNRTLCAHYGLPLQMGGWQDVEVKEILTWMELGRVQKKRKILEVE